MAAAEPLSVRLIDAARAWFGRHRRLALAAVVVLFGLGWLAAGLSVVRTGESAAVRRFGRLVDDAITPGLHLALPPPFARVDVSATGEVQRLEIRGDFTPALDLVSGDENVIEATLVVQYRIGRLGDYLFRTEDARALVEQEVRAALVEAVAATPVDDVLTSAKAAIQNAIRERTQRRLDRWNAGVALVSVSLQSVAPPYEAAKAFRAVSDSRAQAAERINRAQADASRTVSLARGEAARRLEQAEAQAASRRLAAQGNAERFEQLLAAARLAPEQVRTDLWAEVVGRVFAKVRLVTLPAGRPPRVDLRLYEKGAATVTPTASPGPPVER